MSAMNTRDRESRQLSFTLHLTCLSSLYELQAPCLLRDMSPQMLKSKACIGCRTRKVRCNRTTPCANCERWSVRCTYPSPIRRCKREPKKSHDYQNEPNSATNDITVPSEQVPSFNTNATFFTIKRSNQLDSRVNYVRSSPGILQNHSSETWQTIWRTFVERVDPIVKILHSPSVVMIVTNLPFNSNSIGSGESALLYAISFASLAAMSELEAQSLFGTEREAALALYRRFTEQELTQTALRNVDDDFLALQALILFLTVNRMLGEVDIAWMLTGLAKRSSILQRTDLPPFQLEIQKRMAWQLWYLDHRAGKDHGQHDGPPRTPSVDPPTNMNDPDFGPTSSFLPVSSLGWTEQTFALARFDIGITRNELTKAMPLDKKRQTIEECQQRITRKYIKYCTDDQNAVQWLTRHVSHVLIMEMWFELYSADTIPISLQQVGAGVYHEQTFQDHLFLQAIDIVDTSTRLHTEPLSRRWKWLLKGYQQFRPLAFLINELLYRKKCAAVSHAWTIVKNALDQQPTQVRDSVNGKALDALKAKARDTQDRIGD